MPPPTVQIPVLKSGAVKKAQWSTRILTIDVATATVIISRHNHPNNILYHALRVDGVQMWPRFAQSYLSEHFYLLESKLTLRIVGDSTPVPKILSNPTTLEEGGDVSPSQPPQPLSTSPSLSSPPSPGRFKPTNSAAPSSFMVTTSSSTKQSRKLTSGMNWIEDAWMIRFTTFESYQLAIGLLLAMRNQESVALRELCPYAAEDLRKIEKAWAEEQRRIAGMASSTEGDL